MKLLKSNESHVYFLFFMLYFYVAVFLLSDWHTDRKIKDLENKLQEQQADIEELYLRSEELFKRIK